MRRHLVVNRAQRQRASDKAESLANSTVAAHADINGVKGGIDNINLTLILEINKILKNFLKGLILINSSRLISSNYLIILYIIIL